MNAFDIALFLAGIRKLAFSINKNVKKPMRWVSAACMVMLFYSAMDISARTCFRITRSVAVSEFDGANETITITEYLVGYYCMGEDGGGVGPATPEDGDDIIDVPLPEEDPQSAIDGKCDECQSVLNYQFSQAAEAKNTCMAIAKNWAQDQCRLGRWRDHVGTFGTYENPIPEVLQGEDVCQPNPFGAGQFCLPTYESNPVFEQCVRQYIDGYTSEEQDMIKDEFTDIYFPYYQKETGFDGPYDNSLDVVCGSVEFLAELDALNDYSQCSAQVDEAIEALESEHGVSGLEGCPAAVQPIGSSNNHSNEPVALSIDPNQLPADMDVIGELLCRPTTSLSEDCPTLYGPGFTYTTEPTHVPIDNFPDLDINWTFTP